MLVIQMRDLRKFQLKAVRYERGFRDLALTKCHMAITKIKTPINATMGRGIRNCCKRQGRRCKGHGVQTLWGAHGNVMQYNTEQQIAVGPEARNSYNTTLKVNTVLKQFHPIQFQ